MLTLDGAYGLLRHLSGGLELSVSGWRRSLLAGRATARKARFAMLRVGRLTLVVAVFGMTSLGCGGVDCTSEPTPGGYVPRACIIQVPDGATASFTADGGTVITVNGVVVATYPPCPCFHGDPAPIGVAQP